MAIKRNSVYSLAYAADIFSGINQQTNAVLISVFIHCPEKENNKLYHIIKSRKPDKHAQNKHFFHPPQKILIGQMPIE